jgi:predicted DNA-binding ribbon-helix-helix protein
VIPSRLVNRNIIALRGRTSMRLEPELWDALHEVALREGRTLGDIVKRIERHGHPGGRTSAVRVYVLDYFRMAATEDGHLGAGHGSLNPAISVAERPWPADRPGREVAVAG